MKSANPLPFRVLRCRVHAHIGKLRYRITLPGQKRPTFVWQDAVAQGTDCLLYTSVPLGARAPG